MSNDILSVRDIFKSFPLPNGQKLEVLKGASFEISKGESLAIMGVSGSGKTTLLHIAAGIDIADSGFVKTGRIGLIFQAHYLLPEFDCRENVSIAARIQGIDKNSADVRAERILQEVGLGERMWHLPSELSGGETARVAIARALAIEPEVILADEPTGSLDEKTSENIKNLLFELVKRHNTALVIVTHDSTLSSRADRTLHLEHGILK